MPKLRGSSVGMCDLNSWLNCCRYTDDRRADHGLQPHHLPMQDRILFQVRWCVHSLVSPSSQEESLTSSPSALWNVKQNRCSRVPSCELWDEELLLEERERERERERQAGRPLGRLALFPPAGNAIPVARYDPPPPPYNPAPVIQAYREVPGSDLSWIDDPGTSLPSVPVRGPEGSGLIRSSDVLCTRHWFTANMINSLTCQYCDTQLNSIGDLQYHLSHVRWHSVYACCGRFFRREEDFQRHCDAPFTRFGGHAYTVRRD